MTIPPTPNQLPTNPQSSAEQIPASVRSAPVLGGHDISTSTPTAAQSNSAKSWRFDVATPEDFQKYVQMSTQGAVIFGLYAPHSPASLEMLDAVENLVNAAEGAMLLAAVDITKLPEAAQAFGMDGVPAGRRRYYETSGGCPSVWHGRRTGRCGRYRRSPGPSL